MTRHLRSIAALATCAAACAAPSPEQQFVDDLAAALGGRDRILAVRTLSMEGEGTLYNLGQDMRPDASGQTFSATEVKRQVDVAGRRWRMEYTRTPEFLYFQGPASTQLVQGIDGTIGYNVSPNGNAVPVGGRAAEDRRAELYHHPVVVAAAVLTPGATVANVRSSGSERVADVTTADGVRLVVALDATARPVRCEMRSYHPNLGDVTLAAHFADYQEQDGLWLPMRFTTKVDDFTTSEMRLTVHAANAEIADLAAPAAVASAGSPPAPPASTVVSEQVAPGVWLLAGQSHHSALIELSDHLLLVDAPQSEARTLAAIAAARALQPKKPLTKVITTHHHFDHTAGIRAAIAEGLTVVTHQGNRAFFEETAKRPHTIVADTLAQRPREATVETVDDETVIDDPLRRVVLYHVAGNPHSDTMLMVYLPAERLIVEVDAWSPGSNYNPYAANLLDNIRRRKLNVDRIVPLHGRVGSLGELVKAVELAGT